MASLPLKKGPTVNRLETALHQATSMADLAAIDIHPSDNLADLAHDVRNMVTALGLYCELLDEPGVLLPSFRHYSSELKQLAAASRDLVDRLTRIGGEPGTPGNSPTDAALNRETGLLSELHKQYQDPRYWAAIPASMISDLASELESNRNLLAALAGPRISVSVETEGATCPVSLSSEDLTRILVNMVKNAVEAMPNGGRLHFALRESPAAPGENPVLILDVEDNGPGVPEEACERIFEPGFTTHGRDTREKDAWRASHRGLGLSITRSIVEAAGGRIHMANRDPIGACFQMELPVRTI